MVIFFSKCWQDSSCYHALGKSVFVLLFYSSLLRSMNSFCSLATWELMSSLASRWAQKNISLRWAPFISLRAQLLPDLVGSLTPGPTWHLLCNIAAPASRVGHHSDDFRDSGESLGSGHLSWALTIFVGFFSENGIRDSGATSMWPTHWGHLVFQLESSSRLFLLMPFRIACLKAGFFSSEHWESLHCTKRYGPVTCYTD